MRLFLGQAILRTDPPPIKFSCFLRSNRASRQERIYSSDRFEDDLDITTGLLFELPPPGSPPGPPPPPRI